MNAGILPVVLLFLAISLALSFGTIRTALAGAGTAAVAALLASLLPLGPPVPEWIFLGLWLSIIGTNALIYLPKPLPVLASVAVGLNAGFWAGALSANSTSRGHLLAVIPLLLLVLPGSWLVQRGFGIGLKVVGSWLVAIAILAIFILLTPTPGYKPDHML